MSDFYSYQSVVTADVFSYLSEMRNVDQFDRDELTEYLNDQLWAEDSVTGNGSGSYTFSRDKAKWYVLDNIDLLHEAVQEFCLDAETVGEYFLSENWKVMDVCIRLFVLPAAIDAAVESFLSQR